MKRFGYEWMKLTWNRILLAAVFLCLAAVLFYQWQNAPKTQPMFDREQYQAVLTAVMEREPEEAKEWIEKETAWRRFLVSMIYFAEEKEILDMQLAQLEEQYPQTDWEARLETETEEGIGEEDLLQESRIYEEVAARVQYQASYPEFLETVQRQADSMLDLPLFSDMSAFSKRNIVKTAEVYGRLTGQSLGLDYSVAPVVWSESRLADALMLVLILLFGWQIFCREREEGLYPLLLGTRNGRLPLAAGKMTAYVSALAVTAVLLYGGQMLLAFGMYGAGNMSLPLASLSEFRDCPYEISIAQYAWFYLGVKVMGVVLFGGFAMALLTGCRKYGAAVCLYFLIIVLEYLLYVRMDSASPFNGLKYLNLAAVLDAKAWFSTYRNLNVFSHPLSVMPGKLIFAGICAVVTTVLAAWGFCRRTQQRSLPGWNACMEQVQKGMARLPRPGAHGSLFLHEGFKLYRLGAMALVLLVLAAGSVRMAAGIPDREGDPEQRAYTYYLERIQGLYTKETQNLLRKEEAVMALQDEEAKEMERGYQDGTIGKEEYAEWGDERMRMIQARGGGLDQVLEQERVIVQTIQETGAEEKVGFADVNQLSYLFEDDERQMAYAMVFLAVSTLAITRLFGMEYQGMQPLLVSTVRGRRPLCANKMLQSILFLTLLYGILYLPYYWAIWEDLVRVDTGLWLRGVMGYERFEYSISIGQAFGMMVGIRYLTAVSCGMIAAGTAKLVHHPAVGSAVCFLLFLAPCFLYLMGVDLSGWTCVGGFLPQLVYRNGGAMAYLGKLGILLGIDGMVGVFLLRERGRRM